LPGWLSFQFFIRVVKSRAVQGTTERGAQIILDVYRAPQGPSDTAMYGFSRCISQSGKSCNQSHLFLFVSSSPYYTVTLFYSHPHSGWFFNPNKKIRRINRQIFLTMLIIQSLSHPNRSGPGRRHGRAAPDRVSASTDGPFPVPVPS
jgi:hypothetical protein